MRQWLMWIVTGDAGDARVALLPALAVFETIRREANVELGNAGKSASDNVLPGAMARSAKIYGINRIQVRGIENQSRALLSQARLRGGHMACAGSMAGFAGHSRNGVLRVELILRR